MKNLRRSLWIAFISLPHLIFAQLTAEKIIELMEKNQVHSTAQFSGKLIIINRFGLKTKSFNVVTEGSNKLLIEFTNKEERGQKILRLNDEIYVYYPKAEGVMRLKGGALKDSIFGSDFSYEDLTGERNLLQLYQVELVSPELVFLDGVACYHLRLTGRSPVAYPYQELWIEAKRFYLLKAVYYSLTMAPMKELRVTQTTEQANKIFPTRFIMADLQKKDSTTEFIIENIQLDLALDSKQFSLERLKF